MTDKQKQIVEQYRKRYDFLWKYNPAVGGRYNESYNRYIGYVNVGFVKDGNKYTPKGGDAYLFVDLEAPEWQRFKFLSDQNPSADGIAELPLSISSSRVILYPKYKGTIYDELINGKSKSEEEKENDLSNHKRFMSKLNIQNGKVVLLHTSPHKITDGYIKQGGIKNNWTPNNAQGGIFFWATKERGIDKSGGDYWYYCIVPLKEVYDGKNNPQNFKNDKEILDRGYKVIVNEWKDGGVNGGFAAYGFTKIPIPISFIRYNGKVYNSKWNEVNQSV